MLAPERLGPGRGGEEDGALVKSLPLTLLTVCSEMWALVLLRLVMNSSTKMTLLSLLSAHTAQGASHVEDLYIVNNEIFQLVI